MHIENMKFWNKNFTNACPSFFAELVDFNRCLHKKKKYAYNMFVIIISK